MPSIFLSIFSIIQFLVLLIPAKAEGPQKLSPLIVSATRALTDIVADSSSTTIITTGDIERKQYRTLVEALRPVPGVTLVQSGGTGQLSSLFMRGSNSNHALVLIDGIRVNNPSSPNGAFNFAPLQLHEVERIEVIRGPLSSLYGSDAIGGVVYLMTAKGQGDHQTKATVEGGSFHTLNESLSVQGSKERANYTLSLSHLKTAGTRLTPNRLLMPTSDRRPDPYENTSFNSRLGFDANETVSVSLFNRYLRTNLGYRQQQEPLRQQTQDLYSRLQMDLNFLESRWKQTLGVSHVETNQQDKKPGAKIVSDNKGKRTTFDWQHVLSLASWYTATVKAEHEEEWFFSKAYGSKNKARARTNGFAVSNLFIVGDRVFFVASGRIDHRNRFSPVGTYRFSGTYFHKPTQTKFKAGLGTGFKAPTLFQLFGTIGSFQANPALKPEKNQSWEVGLEQGFWSQRVIVGTTYFRNLIADLIAPNKKFTTNINIKKADIYGLESFIEYLATSTLSLRLDHSYTHSLDRVLHKPLLRRPRHKISLSIDSEIMTDYHVNLTILYQGQRADIDSQTFRPIQKGGYTLVNLATSYSINETWKVFGRVDNMLNRRYEEPDGYQHPGFGVFIGIKGVV